MADVLNEITIMLAGEAGAGVQSAEAIITASMKQAGYHVFATKEYMSRVRGGTNSTTIRISGNRVDCQFDKPDIFIPLDAQAYNRHAKSMKSSCLIIGDAKNLNGADVCDVPFNDIALSLGNSIYAAMAASGTVAALCGASVEDVKNYVRKTFEKKGTEVVEANIKAAEKGYEQGILAARKKGLSVNIKKDEKVRDEIMLTGSEAVALGAVAGGCDCAFAYPMTPGTGVFTALASWAEKAGIVIEQVEDEIGVINMALGAWYAGGRAIVTTSGGGFALMTEGISLSGMTETPCVVHVAQRPGPATGLPTRTEQGDLNLVLNAGHGYFARTIYAPGNLEQAYELTRLAFDTAAKFQSPVFILTDQYFTDTYYNTNEFKTYPSPDKHIVKSEDDYMRYSLKFGPISPRSVPGFGTGRVCADSDEHDESGRITEDLEGISMSMKIKRAEKIKLIKAEAMIPDIYGNAEYENLFVCWGSVLPAAKAALEKLEGKNALIHFKQVYPLNENSASFFAKAKKTVIIENSQSAQFKALLERELKIKTDGEILKYDGLAFTGAELLEKMKEVLYG